MVMSTTADRAVEVGIDGTLHRHGKNFSVRATVDSEWIDR